MLLLIPIVFARQNAVIFILCRNSDVEQIAKTVENFEDKFNKNYGYPYVFVNDKVFTDEFKEKLNKATKNNATYGQVEPEEWDMPKGIDENRARNNWKRLAGAGVPYAETLSYHNMCRYYSRGFYKHPLVAEYDWYWRIEPGVVFHCDINFDPFDYMVQNNKKYSFVISIYEFMISIETLMQNTAEFILENNIPDKDNLKFMFDLGKYNGCHFWSNFEIANFDFLRSDLYEKYVDFLDKKGGFYYERWGDAPIHSIAASLFLNKDEIHFFDQIGYTHDIFTHCPTNGVNCGCDTKTSVDNLPNSCLPRYLDEMRHQTI
ncbi:OMH1 [Enterospora canceri]|uniref:OMH1 n=1 Tax=Enterospora canceri TaxID=1081671 RepID=A0A1Y1S6A9_9MICR|nr:OMH1 [Enterospora canceri]